MQTVEISTQLAELKCKLWKVQFRLAELKFKLPWACQPKDLVTQRNSKIAKNILGSCFMFFNCAYSHSWRLQTFKSIEATTLALEAQSTDLAAT